MGTDIGLFWVSEHGADWKETYLRAFFNAIDASIKARVAIPINRVLTVNSTIIQPATRGKPKIPMK